MQNVLAASIAEGVKRFVYTRCPVLRSHFDLLLLSAAFDVIGHAHPEYHGLPVSPHHSSSNVILGSGESIKNGDESWPYPARPNNHYSETKALAEKVRLALASMDLDKVRPHG